MKSVKRRSWVRLELLNLFASEGEKRNSSP
jgi:hypothetical protein